MCQDRNYNVFALLISVLVGIGFAILAFLGSITTFAVVPWIAIGLSGVSVLILTISGTSLLRQNDGIDNCVTRCGKYLLAAAVALFVAGVISILFSGVNALIFVVLVFLVSTLFVYTVISLYGFLACLLTNC